MDRRAFLTRTGAAATIGLTATAGCIGNFGSQPYGNGEINFLMSPTEPQDQMKAQYTPIKTQLKKNIDSIDKVTLKYASDYAATLNAMDSGTADAAETGPFAAALGVKNDKAKIALQRHAYGGWKYRSVIVTKKDSDIQKVSDLKGKKVALADALSASGSLYPLYMMKKAGLKIPESPGSPKGANFDPQWSSHASAKEALVNGQADAAGVGYFIVAGDNSEYIDGVREVAKEDGIPRAPIVVSPERTDEEQKQIVDTFVNAPDKMYYGADGKEGTDDDIWFDGVREASVDTYQPVIDVANELGYGEDVFKKSKSE